jgi:hypothetical protein
LADWGEAAAAESDASFLPDDARPRRSRSARRTKKAASMAQATIKPNVGMVRGPRWRKGIT